MTDEEFDKLRKNRLYKGKSLLEDVADYVVLDLETTGLDPTFDSIIEIAAIKVSNKIGYECFHTLINPGFEIDGFISYLTGITNEMLKSAPKLSDVIKDFLDFLDGKIIVAHNANFDVNFIYDACIYTNMPPFKNDFIDVMRISRRMFPEFRHHRLSDLAERFNYGNYSESAHRAFSDAKTAAYCYEFMKIYAERNSILFSDLYPKRKKRENTFKLSAKDITTSKTEFDEESPIFGNEFVFTGKLEKMLRKEAMKYVVDAGGTCGDRVTKRTNFLVLGNNDYRVSLKNGKTVKQKRAEELKLSGADIEVISEDVFYEFIF